MANRSDRAYTRHMYLLLTGLATAVAAAGLAATRIPRAIPLRVRTRRPDRIVRRD